MNTRSTVSGVGVMGQPRRFRVSVGLESDEVIGVFFHLGQPIDNKLVGLPAGEPQLA